MKMETIMYIKYDSICFPFPMDEFHQDTSQNSHNLLFHVANICRSLLKAHQSYGIHTMDDALSNDFL